MPIEALLLKLFVELKHSSETNKLISTIYKLTILIMLAFQE